MTSHFSYLSSINKMAACKVKTEPHRDEGYVADLGSQAPSDDIGVQPNLKPKKERVHIMTEARIAALKKATAKRMENCAARRAAKEQPISKL